MNNKPFNNCPSEKQINAENLLESKSFNDSQKNTFPTKIYTLGEISEKIKAGGTPSTSNQSFWGGNIPFVKISDITAAQKYLEKTVLKITEEGLSGSSSWVVPKNSLIFSMYGTVGKVVINNVPVAITQNMAGIIPNRELVLLDYLYYYLQFVEKYTLKNYLKLSVHKHFGLLEAKSIKILLPFKNGKSDLKEQKRIADKIDKVRLLQEKSETEIKEAEKLIESVCRQEFERKGSDRRTQKLGDLCRIIKGKFPILKTPEGKYTFVVTAEKRKTANDYQFNDEAVCIPLVSSTGHGHASMHRIHYEKGKFALANIMVALIPKDKGLLTKYLYYYLSFYKDTLFVPLMRGGANVTIPFNELFNVEVSIPKIERQKKLVSVVTKAEELKEKLSEKQILISKLFQSTLNYAFQGKL
jgi:restriction endonuclease S subunit